MCPDFPAVKPSAIALGTIFNHTVELAVLSPIFGQTYQRAKTANTKEEFVKSREATGAAIAWGTALVGSALQSYGVGALINATGTLSYKGAAYLGGLIFAATSAPTVRRPVLSSGPFSGFRHANLASPNTSSSARSLSRSAQPSRSASTSSPSCSRRSACPSS